MFASKYAILKTVQRANFGMFQKFCFQIKTIFGYQVVNKISVIMSNKKMSFFHGRLFDRITVSTVPWDPWEEVLYYSLAEL